MANLGQIRLCAQMRSQPVASSAVTSALSVPAHACWDGAPYPRTIATSTDAPHWVVAVLLAVNAAGVILFQIRLTRGTDSLTGAATAGRRAGLLLCLSCAALSLTSTTSTALTVALRLTAPLFHVGGEILESASGWGASYALAPAGLVGQYQGTHAMGRGLGDLIGPTLLTTLVIPLGSTGWLLTAIIFTTAALLIPVALRQSSAVLAERPTSL
jgi:hypothetical protein